MFTGLSAFPLTPIHEDRVDEPAYAGIIDLLAEAKVDSITALGSTGSYVYLSDAERARVAEITVQHAMGVPVFVGIGALRTSQVIAHAQTAESLGAQGLLLAPVSYQTLTEDDVFGLFADVAAATELPLIVYDNPTTTRFNFSLELYERVAAIPSIASIKIPGVPGDAVAARERVDSIRAIVPEHVTIGVSGDAMAAAGILAGCDGWYSVMGGTLPVEAIELLRAAQTMEPDDAAHASARLDPLWRLFAEHGSFRVIAAIAETIGLAGRDSLPLPIRGLGDADRRRVEAVVDRLGLGSTRASR